MQTRRDQLHAYRFLTKRALAALVTGEPNTVEPPMRRLTVTTISGVMIAVVVAAGFALFGVLKPTAGSSWKQSGQVIIEDATGARYVYINDTLYPVVNYSSAILAATSSQDGGSNSVKVVHVSTSDIKNAKRGQPIGISGIPDSMPSKKNLITSPWAVCAVEEQSGANVVTKVHVHVGQAGAESAVPDDQASVVQSVGNQSYSLLWQKQVWSIAGPDVLTALSIPTDNAPVVRDTFINAIPRGPALAPPTITGKGDPATYMVGPARPLVGQLITVGTSAYVALTDGLAQVNPLQAKLVQALRLRDGKSVPALSAGQADVQNARQHAGNLSTIPNGFASIPGSAPQFSNAAGQAHGVCATYSDGAQTPSFGIPARVLQTYLADTPVTLPPGDATSTLADDVVVAPGRAAMVVSGSGSRTVTIVAAPGRRFAVVNASVLAAFGYDGARPGVVPAAVLALVPTGPSLDPTAARQPATG